MTDGQEEKLAILASYWQAVRGVEKNIDHVRPSQS